MEKILSRQALELHREVTEGADSEFAGLHPWQAEKLRKACSILQQGFEFALGNHWSTLQANPEDFVAAYFAGIDESGAKAQALGLVNRPQVAWMPQDAGSDFPAFPLVTFESATSSRVAVLLCAYTERAMSGYGVFHSAEWSVLEKASCHEEACMWAREFLGAMRDLRTAANLVATYAERKASTRTEVVGSGSF